MDVLDLGSVSNPDPDDNENVDQDDKSESWLAGLFRADALAISAAAIVAVVVMGVARFDGLLGSYLFMNSRLSGAWVYLPQIVGSAVASVVGFMSVKGAAVQDSAPWVRALGGAGAIVGLILALGFAAMLFAADSSDIFDRSPFQ